MSECKNLKKKNMQKNFFENNKNHKRIWKDMQED